MLIESVVDMNAEKSSGGLDDEMCTMCEMTVVWMQNQLSRNQTEDSIIDYVNEVCSFCLFFYFISFCQRLMPLSVTAAMQPTT